MLGLDEYLASRNVPPPIRRRAVLDFNLAAVQFGKWVDRRREEKVLVDAPKRAKRQTPQIEVPKYRTLGALLGLDDPASTTHNANPRKPKPKSAVDRKAEELLRDPEAMARFMQELVS